MGSQWSDFKTGVIWSRGEHRVHVTTLAAMFWTRYEIKKIIGQAKNTSSQLQHLLECRNNTMNTEIQILNVYVIPVLPYGCECWTISKQMKKKLEATDMWFLRRIMRISWVENKSNEEVLQKAKIKRTLMTAISRRQLQFVGHIIHHPQLEALTLLGNVNWRRDRER